ncbi:pelota family protein [Ignicoccus hospitalis]|uniref:Protein pelota homolog n=1 Tax=Ignicoccus hospitalis (strain KIN4/I / DSM 18386 / JCM 14125) TaxID=453591 RepID=PELO_IGNH4|nr:pelota family protein [Ignicoccus hospitalis]A8A935.1 RecName: Full=Protein pelota homolog [Ignicoccus hospitalis KIN4/I]ABU81437.1 putative translation factor pelota [Ignicoccus hospitalis KIN4/I]HIH90256.1 pelota family protein [Desulfurococcaceae archaeon]
MRVLEVNESKGEVKVRVEDEEDVWILHSALRPGDLVRARTARSVAGSSGKEKIPMTLTIKVTGSEFQAFSNVLRVKGVVVEGPDKFGLIGSHHAIKVYPGKEITIIRERGLAQLLERLKKGEERKPQVPVLAVDYDEYSLAVVRGQGIEWVFEGSLRLPGKGDEGREAATERKINELAKRVSEELKLRNLDHVVVVGPGFLKDKVAQRLSEEGFKVKVDSASSGGRAGVLEAIRKGSLRGVAKELESIKALEALEEFVKHVARGDGYALYGVDDCMTAAQANAVKTLIISDDLLHSPDLGERAVELVELAEKKGAEVIIVPKGTEAWERLRPFGDVVCLLRFPISL